MPGVVIDPERRLNDEERQAMQALLAHPLNFPDDFKSWLADWLATNLPKLPVSQVFGFKLENAKVATPISAQQSTSSAGSYQDLATVGPELVGIADGFYILFWGAFVDGTGTTAFMSPSINGATPVDADAASTLFGPMTRALITQISGDNNNTIRLKYKAATSFSFENRWLVALRVTTNV